MLTTLKEFGDQWLGLSVDAQDLTFVHMTMRTLVVFIVALVVARLADRRLMGRIAGYDFMVGIILGSVLSRGINGQAAFFPSLGASLVLVLLHHLVGSLTLHSHRASCFVKGLDQLIVRDGVADREALRRNKITEHDLIEYLRLRGVAGVEQVKEARLERNGQMSVVKAEN